MNYDLRTGFWSCGKFHTCDWILDFSHEFFPFRSFDFFYTAKRRLTTFSRSCSYEFIIFVIWQAEGNERVDKAWRARSKGTPKFSYSRLFTASRQQAILYTLHLIFLSHATFSVDQNNIWRVLLILGSLTRAWDFSHLSKQINKLRKSLLFDEPWRHAVCKYYEFVGKSAGKRGKLRTLV